jgi:putative toxin-antitoxin system antitoxin component (TIGR02293 family)
MSGAVPKPSGVQEAAAAFDYAGLHRSEPTDRIRLVQDGVSPLMVKRLAADLQLDQRVLLPLLNLSVATVNRKLLRNEPLASDEGERVIGVAKLIGQVQAMVEESGEPEGFDAKVWVSAWLRKPLVALGGVRPLDLLDTMEGQAMVSNALARMQSGAYA